MYIYVCFIYLDYKYYINYLIYIYIYIYVNEMISYIDIEDVKGYRGLREYIDIARCYRR